MFNDERISLAMTKVKRLIIIISCVISFCFLLSKLYSIYLGNLDDSMNHYINFKFLFYLYAPELFIFLSSSIVLIGSLFIQSEVKDELYYQKKFNYYKIAFIIFVGISFFTFAICIPQILSYGSFYFLPSNTCVNMILFSSLMIGYGYLRINRIYFNYNIIEEGKKNYYKGVLNNILKMAAFLGIIYGAAMLFSFFFLFQTSIEIIEILLAIIIASLYTIIINVICYLIISIFERLFYKDEDKKQITTPTLILTIIAFVFLIIGIFIQNIGIIISKSGLTVAENIIINNYSNFFRSQYQYYFILLIIFIATDICKKSKELLKKLKYIIISIIVFILFTMLYESIWLEIRGVLAILIGNENTNITSSLFSEIAKIVMIIKNNLKYCFYLIMSIIIIWKCKKELMIKKGIFVNLLLWGITYMLSIVLYCTSNFQLLSIVNCLSCLGIGVFTIVYLIKAYQKNTYFPEEEFN